MTTPENDETLPGAAPGAPSAGVWVAPPRQRWINPDKRTPAILIATAAALVLLVLGGVIGALINDGHRDGHGPVRFAPVGGGYPGHDGRFRAPDQRGPYPLPPPAGSSARPSATTTS